MKKIFNRALATIISATMILTQAIPTAAEDMAGTASSLEEVKTEEPKKVEEPIVNEDTSAQDKSSEGDSSVEEKKEPEEIKDEDSEETLEQKNVPASEVKEEAKEDSAQEEPEEGNTNVTLLEMPQEQSEYILEQYGEDVLNTYDITVPEGTQFPVQITFSADVSDDQAVILFHYTGDEWEEITPDEVDEGSITATFGSLSPVAVVDVAEEDDAEGTEITAEYKVNNEDAGYIEDNTAIANEYYEFINWTSEDGDIVSEDEEFFAEGNGIYTANFAATEYEIFYSATEGGSVKNEEETTTILTGVTGSVAVADLDYVFVNWTDAEDNVVSEETELIPELMDGTYTANFKEDKYDITYEAKLSEDSIEPEDGLFGTAFVNNTEEEVTECGKETFKGATAVAEDGYEFVNWVDADGNEVSDKFTFIPKIVEKDTTFTAVFQSKFTNTELAVTAGEQTITATGVMPRGAELVTEPVTYIKKTEDIVNKDFPEEMKFTAYRAFDIKIMVDGEEWQPIDDGEKVVITISGVDLNKTEEENEESKVSVFRIEDSNKDATNMRAEVSDENEVTFETEHFTIYTIGEVTYTVTAEWYNDYTFTKNTTSNILQLQKYNGSDENIYIPSEATISGKTYAVQLAGGNTGGGVFGSNTSIKNVYISSGVQTRDARGLFRDCTNLENVDCAGLVLLENAYLSYMFYNCKRLESIDISDWDFSSAKDFSYMFYHCENLFFIKLPESPINSSASSTNIDSMFNYCSALKSLNLNFVDTSKTVSAGSMGYITYNCTGLVELDISSWDMTKFGTSCNHFNGCTSLTHIKAPAVPPANNAKLPKTFYALDDSGNLDLSVGYTMMKEVPAGAELYSSDVIVINGEAYTDLQYSWDISAAQDNSIMAYYFNDNSGTLIITGSGEMKDYNMSGDTSNNAGNSPFNRYIWSRNCTVKWYNADGITNIGEGVFYSVKATITTLPSGLQSIDEGAFTGCTLSEGSFTSFPDSITSIGRQAFSRSSGVKITSLPSNLETIGNQAFYYSKNIAISSVPDSVQEIGEYAFYGCDGIEEITLPSGLTKISNRAFAAEPNLKSITYNGSSLATIEERAFWVGSPYNSTNLLATSLTTTSQVLQDYDWKESNRKVSLSVVIDSVAYTYDEAWDISAAQDGSIMAYWNEDDALLIITGSGNMKDYAPAGSYVSPIVSNLKEKEFTVEWVNADNLTRIGDYAFEGCSSLSTIEFINNATLTTIGQQAFSGCSALETIDFTNCTALTNIGNNAFQGVGTATNNGVTISFKDCAGITSLNNTFINAKVKSVDLRGTSIEAIPNSFFFFGNNTTLESVLLPSTVKTIGTSAFRSQMSLANVNFGELTSLESIGDNAFNGCDHLTEIDFSPSILEQIGTSAFANCYSITAIKLPSSVISIGDKAFYACPNLTEIEATGSATLGTSVFSPSDYVPSGVNVFYNYFLDGTYHSYEVPIRTTLTGDADWFDTYDFKGDYRVMGDYTVTLPMSIELEYDGENFGNASYSVDNNTNNWPVVVTPWDSNSASTSGKITLTDTEGNKLILKSTDITYSTDYTTNAQIFETGENEKVITFTPQTTPTKEASYIGELTFKTAIKVG